jgi:hypothetical protein
VRITFENIRYVANMKHKCTILKLLHVFHNFPLCGSFQRICLSSRPHATFQNMFFMLSFSLSPNPHSWRTTSCQLSTNAYSIYMQWPLHTLRPSPPSATSRYDMQWWEWKLTTIFKDSNEYIPACMKHQRWFQIVQWKQFVTVFVVVRLYSINITQIMSNLQTETS